MPARAGATGSTIESAAAGAAGVFGAGLVAAGLWARRDVRRTLARERVTDEGDPVTTAGQVRALAELIRRNTLEATGGRTYAEVEPYVDAAGRPAGEAEAAAKDERTGGPLENPDHDLWIQSTTLQTALIQAYIAFRLSELTVALGASFVAVAAGLAAAARRRGR